jgi:hypothetical protein
VRRFNGALSDRGTGPAPTTAGPRYAFDPM